MTKHKLRYKPIADKLTGSAMAVVALAGGLGTQFDQRNYADFFDLSDQMSDKDWALAI